jgi:LSD1 subclass zinc finger protein
MRTTLILLEFRASMGTAHEPTMQIQCYNCHNPMMVNPQGGQFRCPTCHTINAVGVPVAPSAAPHHVSAAPASAPAPNKDKRAALAIVLVLAVGGGAAAAGWWGVGFGMLFLTWAIAGALGKITGPAALAFPNSDRKTLYAVGAIVLGGFVTVCGVAGVVERHSKAERQARYAQDQQSRATAAKADKEKREADEATAKAAHEANLRANVEKAATDCSADLDTLDTLIAEGKWVEAETKMKMVAGAVADYRNLDPVPDVIASLLPRHDALALKIETNRREREITAWIERAELVVSNKASCEDKDKVEAARTQIVGLQESDANYAKVKGLSASLNACLKNLPPPSQWIYKVKNDPMGGTVATAGVASNNTIEFDFPYQGTQNASLIVRNDDGYSVIVGVQRGQFLCTMGCSVQVRFDAGESQRWRAAGASDLDSTVIFLRNESKFLKQLKTAKVVRVEAEFYQEGTRVLEFPTARFDVTKL